MGPHQEIVAGSALRRIIGVLAVAALMAAMLVVMAAPALARSGEGDGFGHHGGGSGHGGSYEQGTGGGVGSGVAHCGGGSGGTVEHNGGGNGC